MGLKAYGSGEGVRAESFISKMQSNRTSSSCFSMGNQPDFCVYVISESMYLPIDTFKDLCVWGSDVRHKGKFLHVRWELKLTHMSHVK